MQGVDKIDKEIVAIYHSHPRGPARPSATDIEKAVWQTIYVIIDPNTKEVRAFKLPVNVEVDLLVEK